MDQGTKERAKSGVMSVTGGVDPTVTAAARCRVSSNALGATCLKLDRCSNNITDQRQLWREDAPGFGGLIAVDRNILSGDVIFCFESE